LPDGFRCFCLSLQATKISFHISSVEWSVNMLLSSDLCLLIVPVCCAVTVDTEVCSFTCIKGSELYVQNRTICRTNT
jgi:hypothetical protein